MPLVTWRLRKDPVITRGPGGRTRKGGHPGTPRSWGSPEVAWEPGGSPLDPEIFDLNPEAMWELGDPEVFDWNPEAIGEPGGTILRLPRQDNYRYLFGFRILPLGSWPLSSSYAIFYFCRKSLTCLEGAGVGVMTQVPGFAAFHVWRSRVLIAPCISQYFCNNYTMWSLYCVARSVLIHVLFTFVLYGPRSAFCCAGVLGSFDNILRLAHTYSWFMSHTHFDFVDVPLWSCQFLQGFARIGGLWRPDPPRTVLKMIGFEVQGVPAVGLYFTFAILQPVGACSPHLDDLIGSFPPGGFRFPLYSLLKAGRSRFEQVKLFHIRKCGRFSLSEVFLFPEDGRRSLGPDPEYFLAGTRGAS
ncbi:hypothetical protein F2Q70_00004311 [Brassica cretica]|uniref:Uncharacterized protein n=1 Tax=Brassica cretica TaxID=69181 RepID=A0A8S9IQ09_BRACR|nr:hypothetical protein F2Q70_00004311 [Brassica cretica]